MCFVIDVRYRGCGQHAAVEIRHTPAVSRRRRRRCRSHYPLLRLPCASRWLIMHLKDFSVSCNRFYGARFQSSPEAAANHLSRKQPIRSQRCPSYALPPRTAAPPPPMLLHARSLTQRIPSRADIASHHSSCFLTPTPTLALTLAAFDAQLSPDRLVPRKLLRPRIIYIILLLLHQLYCGPLNACARVTERPSLRSVTRKHECR